MLTGKRIALRKEAKISVRLQFGPWVRANEQESKFFRFETEDADGNDNDAIITSIRFIRVTTTHLIERVFPSFQLQVVWGALINSIDPFLRTRN